MESGNEYVWAHHFDNRNIAAVVGSLKVKTYADLAEVSIQQLKKLHLDQSEIGIVQKLLAARGLSLK